MDAVRLQMFQQAHLQAQSRMQSAKPAARNLSDIIESKRQEIFGAAVNKKPAVADPYNKEIKNVSLAYSAKQEILSAPSGKILGRQVDFRA